jgi:hypothetical protein
VPTAPRLLGGLAGRAIVEGALPASQLSELYAKVEDTETRRRGVAEALKYIKARMTAHGCPV